MADYNSRIEQAKLKAVVTELIKASQSRGSEAAGIAAFANNRVDILKCNISPRSFLRLPEYKDFFSDLKTNNHKDNIMIIGHSRMVTNGSGGFHQDNHPIIKNETIGVHNGIVVNCDSLWLSNSDLVRECQVDSEIIFSLLDNYLSRNINTQQAISAAFSQIEGMASIAAINLATKQLILGTNNGSLYSGINSEANLILFASEKHMLERLFRKRLLKQSFTIEQLEPNNSIAIEVNPIRLNCFKMETVQIKASPSFDVKQGFSIEISDNSPCLDTPSKIAKHKNNLRDDVKWAWETYGYNTEYSKSLRRCSKCILPETMPFICFDDSGVCNYCNRYKKIRLYEEQVLQELIKPLVDRTNGPNCLVGISGGRDSCYGLHYIKEVLGLKPIAFTYDWGMITDLARRNISRMCAKLKVEHILISANIPQKRKFIKKNVEAWLKKPKLGMIPLFMAGDKAYFYHANRLKKQFNLKLLFLCENMLERTDFKTGFANIPSHNFDPHHVYTLPFFRTIKLASFYAKEFLSNPAYINTSLVDTFCSFVFYYLMKKEYRNLYSYIAWEEDKIIDVLRSQYDWELAGDTDSTWRIGDGTAPFYNYIYYNVAGFTENDSFRSNQIREGLISREMAIELVDNENKPRYESIAWYCLTNHLDFRKCLRVINALRKDLQLSIPL